jgi:hypothetical protein
MVTGKRYDDGVFGSGEEIRIFPLASVLAIHTLLFETPTTKKSPSLVSITEDMEPVLFPKGPFQMKFPVAFVFAIQGSVLFVSVKEPARTNPPLDTSAREFNRQFV